MFVDCLCSILRVFIDILSVATWQQSISIHIALNTYYVLLGTFVQVIYFEWCDKTLHQFTLPKSQLRHKLNLWNFSTIFKVQNAINQINKLKWRQFDIFLVGIFQFQ